MEALNNRNKKTIILIIAAALAVAAVAGFFGYKLSVDNKYNDKIAIAEKALFEGDYEQAEASYLEAVAIDGKKVQAREGLAYTYILKDEPDKASSTYEELYKDTGDDKYKDAGDKSKDGLLPTDPDLIPGRGTWRSIAYEKLPDTDELIEFINLISMFGPGADPAFDSTDPQACDFMSSFVIIADSCISMSDDTYDSTGLSQESSDPRGWTEDYGNEWYFYFACDTDRLEYAASNMFNISEEDMNEMLSKSESDRQSYIEDGIFYAPHVAPTDSGDVITNIFEVRTDGDKYLVMYETGPGAFDYFTDNYTIDRDSEYYSINYVLMEYKNVDGNKFWSMHYHGTEPPQEYVDAAAGQESSQGIAPDELFASLDGVQFYFSSGAGAWGTYINMHADGTFDGMYSDSEMGVTGDGYPNGSRYQCEFTGKFTEPEKTGDGIYSFGVESLEYEEAGREYIEDGVMITLTDPYGFGRDSKFDLYMPGKLYSELPEGLLNWFMGPVLEENYMPMLKIYGLLADGENGFAGYPEGYWDD